jgi:pantoate--beta-alanine ligase
MDIITDVGAMRAETARLRREGRRVGLVPTMGYLHEGHLSLVDQARQRADKVVVSIFVNPTQFGPGEDFADYPRSFERDCQQAEAAGADIIFAPTAEALYPDGYQTYVTLEHLPHHLCGISRPIHFRGVATVVTVLFVIVNPHVAVFGRKDYQQLLVIRRLARDLHFDIEIVGAPIIREPDGLAMSSRNTYLTESQRESARTLYQSLNKAAESVAAGVTDVERLIRAAADRITARPETLIDYIAVVDPETLETAPRVDRPVLMALAVKVGRTRLIDNMILTPPLIDDW